MKVVAFGWGFLVIGGLWSLGKWGPADDRRSPTRPEQPARIAAPITFGVMVGALVVTAILFAIAGLVAVTIVFLGVAVLGGYYWIRARRWPLWPDGTCQDL
jgi:hypothetical protein